METREYLSEMSNAVGRVVSGCRAEIGLIFTALIAGGHVLIEDVPGVGKTTLASSVASAAGLSFNRLQLTPDVTASDITGYNIYDRNSGDFHFRQGAVICNVLLADEINRASPKTQSALLQAMEEGRVTVDGVTYTLPDPFIVVATQNPAGFIGTFPLPEAQLDRFMLRISLGYPSEEDELKIILDRLSGNPAEAITPAADESIILTLREEARKVTVAPEIGRYIIRLTASTRHDPDVLLGASPRASLSLMKCAQAYAYTHGQTSVRTEDVAAVLRPVFTHRIVIRQEARIARVTADDVIGRIIRAVEVPIQAKTTSERKA